MQKIMFNSKLGLEQAVLEGRKTMTRRIATTEEIECPNIGWGIEGKERESISPKEKLYLDLLTQSQKALRALGMNTYSRERKTDNDGFADFINQFKDEGDDE